MALIDHRHGGAAGAAFSRRHIAVITSPTAGHLNPLQVLGAGLAGAGHRVTIVHVADLAGHVTEPAIGFAPITPGDEPKDRLASYMTKLARPTGPLGLTRMIRATAAMTAALLDGAPRVIERIGADVVLADAVEPAGPLIAQRIGVPHVVSVTGLPLLREADVPPPFVGWRYRPDDAGRSRNKGGYAVSDWLMRPITRVIEERRRTWGLAPEGDAPLLYVAQCPRGLDFPRRALPPRFLYGSPWRGVAAEPLTLPDDGRPLVFCSLGTLQGRRRRLFVKMARACAQVGARAVIAHGGGLTAAEEAMLPGDPLVRAFWPQEAVLRRCAAAILHGGFNTVLDALAAGVPMVILPIAFEQPATAARVARIGAGRVVAPRSSTVQALARALDGIMHRPEHRVAAQAVAAEMRATGGVSGAVAAINAALAARP